MKSFLVALMVVSAVAVENVCTPGAFFKIDCNTCACSSDGKSAACTTLPCSHEGNANVNDINTVQAQPKQVCKPGSQFNDYCNVCTCSTDGTFSMRTRMYCDKNIWNKDGSLRIVRRSKNANGKVCSPNSHFKEECNTCICSQDGLSKACTMMTCNMGESITDTLSSKKQVCTPNSHFKEECNTCVCSQNGLSKACTMMTCNMGGPIMDILSSKKQVCTPNSHFKEECNTCVCSQDGLSKACTMMICNMDGQITDILSSKRQVCTPNSHFKEECNTCICSQDGFSKACTMMTCNMGGPITDSLSYKKQVCTPNSHFKEACNTCVCSQDGLSMACTTMICYMGGPITDTSSKICEPGKAYSPDGCNTCICSLDGTQSACTFKLCLSGLKKAYEDAEEDKRGPLYKQGDVCTPGKAFYSQCNRCVCGATGRSAFCTLMSCQDKSIRN